MVPLLRLNEGGQSVAGAPIVPLTAMHFAAMHAPAKTEAEELSLLNWLARRTAAGLSDPSGAVDHARGLRVVTELLGNRAPHADPAARAVIAGYDMEDNPDSLVALYFASLGRVATFRET